MASVGTNLTWHEGINYAERKAFTKQLGMTIWFTGLSASGKSTIACELERQLLEKGVNAYRLDGDNIRMGLNNNLGFSEQDRVENIRRIGEVAKLFADSTAVAITSFISPYASDRNKARELHEKVGLPFLEVYVNVPVEVAEQRDPKGLYAKARRGEIKEFTGISAPYEAPTNPEIEVTHNDSVEESVQKVISYLREHKLVSL